jgi:hypothetical protein
MIRAKSGLFCALLILVLPVAANATVISYSTAQIDALLVEGTVTNFTPGLLIAGDNLLLPVNVGRSLDGGNSYDFPNDMSRQAAASVANNRWIQTDNDEIWDLGGEYSTIVVGNGFDHDRSLTPPVLYLEALEYTAWGSNVPFSPFGGEGAPGIWELALLSAVYTDGWTFADTWDDFTAELNFASGNSYRYIHVIAADSISIGGMTSADNEIDFVAGRQSVPEPGTLMLLGLGLVSAGLLRRRRV